MWVCVCVWCECLFNFVSVEMSFALENFRSQHEKSMYVIFIFDFLGFWKTFKEREREMNANNCERNRRDCQLCLWWRKWSMSMAPLSLCSAGALFRFAFRQCVVTIKQKPVNLRIVDNQQPNTHTYTRTFYSLKHWFMSFGRRLHFSFALHKMLDLTKMMARMLTMSVVLWYGKRM